MPYNGRIFVLLLTGRYDEGADLLLLRFSFHDYFFLWQKAKIEFHSTGSNGSVFFFLSWWREYTTDCAN